MDDDDMFLVIVGDESGEMPFPMPKQIKQELMDESDIETILDIAEKHGEFIKIKEEREESPENCEYLEGDESQIKEYLESQKTGSDEDDEYIPEYATDSDHEGDYENTPKNKQKKSKFGRTMLGPEDRKSFVEDLREEYPELRNDTKLLVNTLCEIMRSVKRPQPPDDYYVLNDHSIECPRCGHCSESLAAAGRHYQEKHGPRYLICYACGVDFRSCTNLYKHEKRCAAPDRAVVLRARAAVLGNKGRSRPYLSPATNPPPKLAKPKYQCTECSAMFHTRNNLLSHEYLHRGERPFRCSACPAAYTSQSALLRHTKKHSDVEYICDHCNRSFKVKAALSVHMDTHREVRRFGCAECGRRYAQKAALVLHVDRVHHNLPPPHACDICPKRYPRLSLLKNHMKNEHGLIIMTRKMFFKQLPMLSEEEMKQAAKLVFKSDVGRQNYFKKMDDVNEDLMEEDPSDTVLPDDPTQGDFVEYLQRLTEQNKDTKVARQFIIENGEVVEIRHAE